MGAWNRTSDQNREAAGYVDSVADIINDLIRRKRQDGVTEAKGYWVVFADVSDSEGYKEYIAANGPALAKYGARFLARDEAKTGSLTVGHGDHRRL